MTIIAEYGQIFLILARCFGLFIAWGADDVGGSAQSKASCEIVEHNLEDILRKLLI